MQTADVPGWVIRLDRNYTAQCHALPERTSKKGRPPEYGLLVRPLERMYKGHTLPATPPDVTTCFAMAERRVTAHGWHKLVRSDQKVAEATTTFTIWVHHDPLYREPLVLTTNLTAQAVTIYQLYSDRRPVEEVPLACKQLLELQRQFVFATAARFRLPELGLLAANILAHLAAELPALPTGFWDRQRKRTLGRLRRVLV